MSPQWTDERKSRHIWMLWKQHIFNMTSHSSLWQMCIVCAKIKSRVMWITVQKYKIPHKNGQTFASENKKPMINSIAHDKKSFKRKRFQYIIPKQSCSSILHVVQCTVILVQKKEGHKQLSQQYNTSWETAAVCGSPAEIPHLGFKGASIQNAPQGPNFHSCSPAIKVIPCKLLKLQSAKQSLSKLSWHP